MIRTLTCSVLASALISVGIGVANADTDDGNDGPYMTRQLAGRKLSEPPLIDGDLSDSVWEEAATADRFTDGKTGEEVSDKTRFWIGYDDYAIYLAARCYDSEPDGIVMERTGRDSGFGRDDHIDFSIDTYHTHFVRFLVVLGHAPRNAGLAYRWRPLREDRVEGELAGVLQRDERRLGHGDGHPVGHPHLSRRG